MESFQTRKMNLTLSKIERFVAIFMKKALQITSHLKMKTTPLIVTLALII